jgi:hypothetical protein
MTSCASCLFRSEKKSPRSRVALKDTDGEVYRGKINAGNNKSLALVNLLRSCCLDDTFQLLLPERFAGCPASSHHLPPLRRIYTGMTVV